MDNQKQKFGLLTTVSMIAGVVIGSGIFFKTDDILLAANGSPLLGALILTLGATGIIFGGLCISNYAKETHVAGGLITYIEMAWGKTAGYLAGWFQTFFYFPAIIAILSWIGATYTGFLFRITDPLDVRLWLITLGYLVAFFALNIVNTKGAGLIQNITLIIKLGALLVLAASGLVFGDVSNLSSSHSMGATGGLFMGLVACAFSYDGWFVAPSIAHEIKNPKRNLSRALILAPLLILGIYLFYFLGISIALGSDTVIALGDDSVGQLALLLGGPLAQKSVYVAVVISILGSINGLILGNIRLPYSLALRDHFPKSNIFKKLHPAYDIPIYSAILTFVLVLVWLGLHGLSVFHVSFLGFGFTGLRIDNLPIILTYFFYISLFIKLPIRQYKTHDLGFMHGYLYPILAILGSLLILIGGFSDPDSIVYIIISLAGILMGYLFMDKKQKSAP